MTAYSGRPPDSWPTQTLTTTTASPGNTVWNVTSDVWTHAPVFLSQAQQHTGPSGWNVPPVPAVDSPVFDEDGTLLGTLGADGRLHREVAPAEAPRKGWAIDLSGEVLGHE